MAFQFPAAPVIGQEFTPIPGLSYRWNGTAWFVLAPAGDFLTENEADLLYLQLIGGTLSGPVNVPAGATGTQAPQRQEIDSAITAGVATVIKSDIRQTVLSGVRNSNGYANFLIAGTGLALNLVATADPLVTTYAAGFAAAGAQDFASVLSADTPNVLTGLAPSNTTFTFNDHVSASAVAWGQTTVPPQYGYAFDRTQNALLHFDGGDASTTMLDDFGNTWSVTGNAQLDTAQFKFGTASLLLDGTGDALTSTSFTSFGSDSWEMSCWFRINALPGAPADVTLMIANNATQVGTALVLNNTAGTVRFNFYASSNGTTQDIALAVPGVNTTWTLNQWNKARIVFDALAGTYRVYLSLNGAAESQDISVSSTAKAAPFTTITVGGNVTGGNNYFNGWIDEFRLIRGASATATQTPPAVAFTVNQAGSLVNWFDIPAMVMREVTGPSVAAGTNPVFTARRRVFTGECDTSGVAVTAVRNYALRGAFIGPWITPLPTTNTVFSSNHNLGVQPADVKLQILSKVNYLGHIPGDIAFPYRFATAAIADPYSHRVKRNAIFSQTGASTAFALNVDGGSSGTAQPQDWSYRHVAERGW